MVFSFKHDYYNKENRNTKNTHISEYNCGGYALGTFNWYCPYDSNHKDRVCTSFFGMMSKEETLDYMVQFMLEDFKDELRLINSVKELNKNEYAIAFRIGYCDFHFIKRGRNGVWYHKMGNNNIERFPKERVFADSWSGGDKYDSRVVLFAMQEKVEKVSLIENIKNLLTND